MIQRGLHVVGMFLILRGKLSQQNIICNTNFGLPNCSILPYFSAYVTLWGILLKILHSFMDYLRCQCPVMKMIEELIKHTAVVGLTLSISNVLIYMCLYLYHAYEYCVMGLDSDFNVHFDIRSLYLLVGPIIVSFFEVCKKELIYNERDVVGIYLSVTVYILISIRNFNGEKQWPYYLQDDLDTFGNIMFFSVLLFVCISIYNALIIISKKLKINK